MKQKYTPTLKKAKVKQIVESLKTKQKIEIAAKIANKLNEQTK